MHIQVWEALRWARLPPPAGRFPVNSSYPCLPIGEAGVTLGVAQVPHLDARGAECTRGVEHGQAVSAPGGPIERKGEVWKGRQQPRRGLGSEQGKMSLKGLRSGSCSSGPELPAG